MAQFFSVLTDGLILGLLALKSAHSRFSLAMFVYTLKYLNSIEHSKSFELGLQYSSVEH